MTATTELPADEQETQPQDNPWRALWAMLVGFFMILVDSTIVAVANPRIMEKLNTDYDAVIWVTSAYLLAYAVPLLVSGRLGDRFGPKNLYLIGLAIFTAASLWCGLAGSVEMLIAARVVQGLGAALLTPQTLSTITRIFPPERRGVAMSLWGATAGVATLVGPLAGGALVDSLGWQWIFFVNVPVGVVGIALAVWLIPVLPTHRHRFDVLGVLLSGIAMFLVVFGLQEGQSHNWAPWIWGTIAGGVAMMSVFVYWQSVNKHEPLIPLRVFRDRDFSLSNAGIAVMGFVAVGMILPLMFYLQGVCGLSPTRSALITAPMAVATGLLAPVVGHIVDRSHPRPVVGFGFAVMSIALTWLSFEMTPTTPIWRLLLPFAAMGVGMAFIWAPLAVTATRNLPPELAGAGSGVYNATRQVGSVLGSASMAALMTWRISDELPPMPQGTPRGGEGAVNELPAFLHQPFSDAMSISMLLPAFVGLFGVVSALFLVGGRPSASAANLVESQQAYVDDSEPPTDELPTVPVLADSYGGYVDDHDYAEYSLAPPEPDSSPIPTDERLREEATATPADDSITEPLAVPSDRVRSEPIQLGPDNPNETLYHEPPEHWLRSTPEPIGFAHNGLHVKHEDTFREVGQEAPSRSRHASDSSPKFTWFDPDADSYGRHAMPASD